MKKIILNLLILTSIVSIKLHAGCSMSKSYTLKHLLSERFCEQNVKLIIKQHPLLTLEVAEDIFFVMDGWGEFYKDEKELLSVFTLFASVRVGFTKI